MKTIIIAAVLMICLNQNSSAQTTELNAKVAESFHKRFPGATSVTWDSTRELAIALFQYEQRTWIAYFNHRGELLASARRIREVSHLPMTVQTSLKNFQNQQSVRNGPLTFGPIYEVIERDHSYYFIPMETKTRKLSVSISNDGYAMVQKKENKMLPVIQENRALLAKKN